MTRELNQLIKKLKTLSPDDVARVQQFLLQVKSPDLRGVPVELKAVQDEPQSREDALVDCASDLAETADTADTVVTASSAGGNAHGRDAGDYQGLRREPIQEVSAEAEVAHAACAQWRRRPFQAIDADDLQPIAALFREAVDIRAASRFRFGSR